MAPSVLMVELRKTGGDTLEFHKACESSYVFFFCLFFFGLVINYDDIPLWFICSSTKSSHQGCKTLCGIQKKRSEELRYHMKENVLMM